MPVPHEVVAAQLEVIRQAHSQAIVVIKMKEVSELPNILHPGENILAITSGTKEGGAARWLLVLTEQRVISLDKGFFGKLSMVELPIASIQGVSHSVGIVGGDITIATAGPAWRLTNVFKPLCVAFATALAALLSRRSAAQPAAWGPQNAAPRVDVVGQLERLAQLRTAGHLTDAEFEAQKGRLLSGA